MLWYYYTFGLGNAGPDELLLDVFELLPEDVDVCLVALALPLAPRLARLVARLERLHLLNHLSGSVLKVGCATSVNAKSLNG